MECRLGYWLFQVGGVFMVMLIAGLAALVSIEVISKLVDIRKGKQE